MMKTENVIYEETLKFGKLFKVAIAFVYITLSCVTVLMLITDEIAPGFIDLGTLIFLYSFVPKKYQILKDRIRVVCNIMKFNLFFDKIESIEIRPPSSIYASTEGIRLGTGTGQNCLLIKKRGMNVILQPMNTNLFIQHIRQAAPDIPVYD